MAAFQLVSPSSSRCCCQHRYSAGVDAAYNDSDVSDEDGVVEDVNGMRDGDGGRTFDEDGRRRDGRRFVEINLF
ncbi:hypothetical protein RHMOL_Rhmol07G0240900 [Rhododendron molle]|uniref:Uncharacterized protein n=1 Tax=Rhododendron molle TaxID=49168 RepID=A0ACC0N3X4_RHOML|nr:hypothetical protein RHMOL_Rhmol07G0240900 [Rhododendron molle]